MAKGSVGRGTAIRRAIERRIATATAVGGVAGGAYLIALSETPPDETLGGWALGGILISGNLLRIGDEIGAAVVGVGNLLTARSATR